MSNFSFAFSGDDIEEDKSNPNPTPRHTAETGTLRRPSKSSSAFPIAGQNLLPPKYHDLSSMLKSLPSKIAYGSLVVKLDGEDGETVSISRRELWDVRIQLMAEDGGEGERGDGEKEGLGGLKDEDVRTGVYEGGFKSWESSVDVVKVLAGGRGVFEGGRGGKVLELGCGTALPSLAVFQWLLNGEGSGNVEIGLADYNPTVLHLVTLPNVLLTWAQVTQADTWEPEGELDIDEDLITSFLTTLQSKNITLSFFSGAWSPDFVTLVSTQMSSVSPRAMILGAETIYSPAALKSFAETLLGLMGRFGDGEKSAIVAAKKVYFGVGGSMEDFCEMVRGEGKSVVQIREENDGVRRAIVEVRDN